MADAKTAEQSTLGERVRGLRQRLRLSQADFAARLGVDQSKVSRWEHGTAPSDEHILLMAELAGMHPAEIRYGDFQSGPQGLFGAMPYVRRKVPVVGAIVGPALEITFHPNDDPERGLELVDAPDLDTRAPMVAARVEGEGLPLLGAGALAFFTISQGGVDKDCLNRLCVVKLQDQDRVLLREVRRGYQPDTYLLIGWLTVPIEDVRLAWASPVVTLKP